MSRRWSIFVGGSIGAALALGAIAIDLEPDEFAALLVAILVIGAALIWWKAGPAFRADFRRYWSGKEIARRMDAWVERNRRP